jgi:Flp pilus assembly protein TadD
MKVVISTIDSAISGGYLSTATDALKSISVLPPGEEDLLAILKRAFQISSLTGDYGLLADLAAKSLALRGGNERIRAVAGYGALRAGRLSEARGALARGSLPHETGELLRGELALRLGEKWAGSDSLSRDLLALQASRDPAAYTAAALRTGDKRLFLDAALLHMEAGSPAKAQLVVDTELGDAAFDDAAAAIFYDAGDFQAALARLARFDAARPGRAEAALVMADASMALGSATEAERALLRALPLAPRLSWTPYANLGFLAMRRGDLDLAGRRLDTGLAFFPQSSELALARARLYARAGNNAAAVSVLSKLVERQKDNAPAALLLVMLQAPTMSPEQYRARLWKLFNEVPSDPTVFAALCMSLLAAHDWEGAASALDQHEQTGGPLDKDLLLIKGMVRAMQGDAAGALEAFGGSDALAKDGVGRYDLALVLLRQGAARRAAAELAAASEQYALRGSTEGRSGVLSKMAMLRGSALLLDGDTNGARSALSRSLALDPQNLRAALLLRKLDAEGQ